MSEMIDRLYSDIVEGEIKKAMAAMFPYDAGRATHTMVQHHLHIVAKHAFESGKTYAWCACGRSSNQPWCDGSHQVTSLTPLVFVARKSETKALCMCKQTKNPPYCDGSHRHVQ